MILIQTLEEATTYIKSQDQAAHGFQMSISNKSLDGVGVNMAVITDFALANGWWPDGFEQQEGFRVYRYVNSSEI